MPTVPPWRTHGWRSAGHFWANAHVDALTEAFGTTCVAGMKNAVLGMDDRTVELQKEYNALVSQYPAGVRRRAGRV